MIRYLPATKSVELLTILKKSTKKYGFPGGKIESGETLWDATVRETREEIGSEIKLLGNQASRYKFRTQTGLKELFVFPARVISGEPRIAEPDKLYNLMWAPIHQYMTRRSDLMDYVSEFAREPHCLTLSEAFGAEISELESKVKA